MDAVATVPGCSEEGEGIPQRQIVHLHIIHLLAPVKHSMSAAFHQNEERKSEG
jgi:hypothetical protein